MCIRDRGGIRRSDTDPHPATRGRCRQHRPAPGRIQRSHAMNSTSSRASFSRTGLRALATPVLVGAAVLLASSPAFAVKPFTADYEANYMGMQAQGQMTLASAGGDRWKYTLSIHNGLAQLSQSTVFEDKDGKWRPLSGTDSSMLLVKHVNKNATYDWAKREARWSGDVKPDRSGPVTLQPGDLVGH